MKTVLRYKGWGYVVSIEHYQPEQQPIPCQDHDDPNYSDPGCGAEVDFYIRSIFPDGGSLDDIPDSDNFTAALLDHLVEINCSV